MRLRIREYREEMQLTQKQLAEKIMGAQRNISNWENGSSEPDCETLIKLADVFHVSLDELFGREKVNFGTANDWDRKLLRVFRRLTPDQKTAVFRMIVAFERESRPSQTEVDR